jgi:uncharacterized repeat protein (TIGR03803 family)
MTYISVARLGSFPSLSHPAVLAGLATLAIATFTPVPSSAAPATIIVKASFLGTNGAQPKGAITAAGDGHYYGTTSSGGANNVGAIFEFDPAANNGAGTISLKGSFNGTNGRRPVDGLIAAGNGKYYGTAPQGGVNGLGAIFEFDPAANNGAGSISLKGSFNGSNGRLQQQDSARLTAAGNGKYFGTTPFGGATNNGTIFEFDPAANNGAGSISLKHSFNRLDGSRPIGGLTATGNGKYFGTTLAGGPAGWTGGVVFEFDPAGNNGSGSIVLKGSYPFTNVKGLSSSLTAAGDGKYYGTTRFAGVDCDQLGNGCGTVFEFNPAGNRGAGTVTLKGKFLGASNGRFPNGLTAAGNGKFFGTTILGGANDLGAIFEFDPAGNNGGGSISLKASFDRTIGSPFADLKAAGNGRYYGSTVFGANGHGVIYEFNPGLACP